MSQAIRSYARAYHYALAVSRNETPISSDRFAQWATEGWEDDYGPMTETQIIERWKEWIREY